MKRFLPSSVMLIPFVVKHYDQNEEEDQNLDPPESAYQDEEEDA